DALDGLDTRLAQACELLVGGELRGVCLGGLRLHGHLRELALLVVERLREQHVRAERRDGQRERAEHDVHEATGATGGAAGAAALVGRDQVDSSHATASWIARPAATARRPGAMSPASPSAAPGTTSSASSTPSAAAKPGISVTGPVRTQRATGASVP